VFTDQPVTPLRLETLLDVVFDFASSNPVSRETLCELLQPDGLPGLKESRVASAQSVRAATELELVEEVDGLLVPASHLRPRPPGRTARDMVLTAVDERVLAATRIEPWLAPFYAFLLGLNGQASVARDHQDWANRFNQAVFGFELPPNPLNKSKLEKLWRWLAYAGLGWVDPYGVFQCNPYERLQRAIPAIFGRDKSLEVDDFMQRMALACPELDGGQIFLQANPAYDQSPRTCTLGLSQALVEMHEVGLVVLQCPPDSQGWSIELAEPTRDGRALRSERVSTIDLRSARSTTHANVSR
jgi:hypothetical protein